jgi:signal transduction histidine kinase
MAGGTLTTLASELSEADTCFIAYAAHELRGSITLQLTLAETTLADPNADTVALREMGERVVDACERQALLLEALLTLARGEHGRLRREPVDLAATAAEALRGLENRTLVMEATLGPAWTAGDPQLIERLVGNLMANADRHNIPGGSLELATYTIAGRAIFTISNTGPVIPTGDLSRLFQPFQRLSPHSRLATDGVGLGLTIVQAIANAHDATIAAQARNGGGLRIDIDFPATRPKPLAAYT